MTTYNVVSPSALVAGQPEDISVVLANFNAIAAVLNGGIDNANINASAAIALSKLAGYPSDNTKFARGDGSWAVPPIPTVGYGTSFPGSPADGDEYILVDSTSAPTYAWHFRYNSGSGSSYKWEFIGGSPVVLEVATAQSTTSTSYTDLTTSGPSFTTPRAGDWVVEIQAKESAAYGYMSYALGGTSASDVWGIVFDGDAPGGKRQVCGFAKHAALAASSAITAKYRSIGGTSATFEDRRIKILPVRLS